MGNLYQAMIEETTEKQNKIYNYYGFDTQMEKLEEECLELALAIKHRDRPYTGIGNVIEEMADVLNIIGQIKNNNKQIEEGLERYVEYKTNRELDRISRAKHD